MEVKNEIRSQIKQLVWYILQLLYSRWLYWAIYCYRVTLCYKFVVISTISTVHLSDRRINQSSFKTTLGCVWLFSPLEGSRLIVIRGFKINLDLRTYGNSTQLLQIKLKLLQSYQVSMIECYHSIWRDS